METFSALLAFWWSFVRGIHRSPVNSPHKGQWRGALMLSLICARINGWVNSREAGDLRRHRTHYDVIVMPFKPIGHHVSNISVSTYSVWMFPKFELYVTTCLPGGARTDVPQSLSSTVPLFTSPYVSQSRCSPTLYLISIFPSPFLPPRGTPCFPVSVFPSPFASQYLCSPAPLFPSPDIPHKWFPVAMFPKDIPQSLCSPRPFVPQIRSSPDPFPVPIFPIDVPQSLCST